MMRKILIVTEYANESQNSTGYFWAKAIEKLRKDGFEVEVITLEKSIKDSVRASVFGRALIKFKVALKLAYLTSSRAKKGDIVFSGTNPEMLLVIMALLRFILGFRWYVLVHDVFPENLVPAGILRSKNLIYYGLKIIFDWVYAQADILFVIGRDMKDLVERKTRNTTKVVFIHNWVDSENITPIKKEESKIIQELNLEDKIVFQFFGNIGRVQGIPNVFKAIDFVTSKKAAFVFIGVGVNANLIVDYQKSNPDKCIYYYGNLPQSENNAGLAACDVALIPLATGMRGLGVPSKAYFSMAADRPILAVMDGGSEITMMIEEEDIGWTCPSSDPRALAKKIDEICQSDLSVYSGKIRNLALTKYSEVVALNELSRCISI